MFVRKVDCAVVQLTFALICIFAELVYAYVLPNPTFEVLKPQGLRVSIPDAPGLQLFGFHANVNKAINIDAYGDMVGNVYSAINDRWTFEDSDVTIREGDVFYYWIYAQVNGQNHKKDQQIWTYSSAIDQAISDQDIPQQSTMSKNKIPTVGQLLLEDNFDSFNTSLWKRDIKMPLSPDYEFCVYHNEFHQQLVQVKDGRLHIKPIILEDSYGENATIYGRLQLNGCTSTVPAECTRRGITYNILPPIISARLTTKEQFAFRYGKIEIRAKFPQGDWLYPEMWLDPKYSVYGAYYASGRILLGLVRGNENLVNATDVTKIFDSRRLDFGVRIGMSPNIQEILVSKMQEFGSHWTQDFHVYTTIWTNNGFTFLIDNEEIGQMNPDERGWMNGPNAGRKSAPFDQEFYLTLGLGAGGVRVFPDNTISSGLPKPWSNLDVKAMQKFWKSRTQWIPSWRQNHANEYILRKCIATAELIRKHRNEETIGVNSRKTEDLFQSQVQQQRNPDFIATILTISQPEVSKQTSSNVYRRMTHMRRRANGHARITGKQLADTPLKTVNIDAPEDRPLAFKKKNPLPELAHDVSDKKIDSSPHMIIIKSVT